MRENSLKAKLREGRVGVGIFANSAHASFIEAAGLAGLDFCVIDMEHGSVSPLVAEDLCRAAQVVGMTPVVRVRKNDGPLLQRALDIGSGGVQVPQVETAEDAAAVVHGAKYAPQGARGLSFYTRAAEYGLAGNDPETLRTLNEEQLVIVQVEGVRGIENLDRIAAVPGIDVIFIGPNDLSQSLGIPGQIESPQVLKLMEVASGKIRGASKFVGTYANDTRMGRRWAEVGVQYIAISQDLHTFLEACRTIVREMQAV
jgi:4-hydroxy-2-oxoheptanedioate aldolase